MRDKKIKIKSQCIGCRHRVFRLLNGWEWRIFKFHCLIICNKCYRTAHGWGITPTRAYKSAMKEWEKNNEQHYQ